MGVRFTPSAARHGVTRQEAIHAVTHAVGQEEIQGRPGETTYAYVGLPHPQALRHIEVLVAIHPPGDLVIFHAMEVTDFYRHLIPR